jgi:molybdopterin/thiamine biosynthesis adenylyltransferase
MLSDAQIERFSRQVLLPEAGGRGQERLLAARVRIIGTGTAAELASLLVSRAGPSLVADDGDVVVDLTGDAAHTAEAARRTEGRPLIVGDAGESRVVVATLVGHPCGVCLPANVVAVDGDAEAPAAYALGSLAAAEALRALLVPPDAGRLHTLDLASGSFGAQPLASSTGCTVCGGSA